MHLEAPLGGSAYSFFGRGRDWLSRKNEPKLVKSEPVRQ